MSHDLEPTKALTRCSEECIHCNACREACDLLQECNLNLGKLAAELLESNGSQQIHEMIQRCALCGFCTRDCPAGQDAGLLFEAARAFLVDQGSLSLNGFEAMFVDRDWNAFSLYRDTFKINYEDLQRDHYDTLLFPGCSLATYAPQLTRAAHSWLQSRGMALGFIEMCCGKPLSSIGLENRKDELQGYLASQLRAAGATRVVTVCPNCHANLSNGLKEIEVVSLYTLLREAGIRLEGTESLTIHDSCPDRESGVLASNLRTLAGGHPVVEMEHSERDTICCGAGGVVSAIDPGLCLSRTRLRVDEFEKSGAECMVTSCMACSRRLLHVAKKGQVRHCLELVFGIEIDYQQIERNQDAMWEGEWGEFNRSRLAYAKRLTGKVGHV